MEALAQPELKAKLLESGVIAAPMGGKDLRSFIRPQAALYREVVRSAKITTE